MNWTVWFVFENDTIKKGVNQFEVFIVKMESSKELKILIFLAWSITLASKAESLPTTSPDFDEALNTDKVIARQALPVSESTSTVNFLTGDFKQQVFWHELITLFILQS